LQVLVADDDATSRELVGGLLTHWGYKAVFAENGVEALNILESPDPPLLAIVDWVMPEMDGIDLCRAVRRNRQYPYTYIIVATSITKKQDLLSCLEAGADDYVCKPLHATELRARLYVAGRILNLQQQLLTAYNEAQYEATHDSVTGLWNRTSILKFLDHYLGRCAKSMGTLSLILVELSGLKEVNNDYGRTIGDRVLREAADRLRAVVKAYDCIGRYLGGEFLIVMPNCASQKAEALVEEMQAVVATPEFRVPDGAVRLHLRTAVIVLTDTGRENTKSLMERLERSLVKGDWKAKAKSDQPASPTEPFVADPDRAVVILSYDPLERGLLCKKVRDLGYTAVDASSPKAAMDILHGPKQAGMLIIDMRNPEPEELDFIAGLRMDAKFAELDVLVVTAWPVQKTVNRALSLNVSSFLTKPVDPVKLGQILSHLMGIPGEPLKAIPAKAHSAADMRM
jgi:diguanylate cyclase (GGDEF)-like protein